MFFIGIFIDAHRSCGDKNNYYDDVARCSPFGWFFSPTSLRNELKQLNAIRSRISIENGNWNQLMWAVFVLSSQSRLATSIEMSLKNQWQMVIFTGFHYATIFRRIQTPLPWKEGLGKTTCRMCFVWLRYESMPLVSTSFSWRFFLANQINESFVVVCLTER